MDLPFRKQAHVADLGGEVGLSLAAQDFGAHAATGIDDCVLVGHSDGGTIALNYAAADPEPLRAVVTLAAHAINEPICVRAMASVKKPML